MPKKLLLADDSITIQKVVGITLANEDLEITSVDNGEDAIEKARQMRPDLVLADASMPRKDGYEVAAAIKGDPATASIPVVILAGQLEGHPDQARLTSSRADGFIPKPFQSQELIERVRKILGLAGPVAARPPSAARAVTPAATDTAPRPAAAVAPAPAAPSPRPAPQPAAAPAPAAMDEADFGDLSAAPAASGDQDLWDNAPAPAEEDLWGESAAAPADAASAAGAGSPGDAPELVTNAAELANMDRFGSDSEDPSGLELDAPSQPKAASNGSKAGVAAALEQIPPEKLEEIIREAARGILQPILEKIAWEVVPDLAEDIIKDEIKRLTR